ncbi:hypothetical protein ACHAXA_004143 [Cyclostephanos tholiformis]|uniref:lipoyl(octanoyl) transferase n=1 Tax=Cyclostephanos tholiformis TaxID=382380 RepID=A0ABD3RB58_9STRA
MNSSLHAAASPPFFPLKRMHIIHKPSLTFASLTIFFIVVLHVNLPSVALFYSRSSCTITRLGTVTSTRRLNKYHRAHLCLVHHGKSSIEQYPRQRHHVLHLAPQQLGEFEEIPSANGEKGRWAITRNLRRVWLYDFVTTTQQQSSPHARTIPYHEAWDLQKKLVEYQLERIGKLPKDPPLYGQFVPVHFDSISNHTDGDLGQPHSLGCDSVIMLQHDPVYTLGTASDPSFILGYDENKTNDSKIPIVRIERGGEVTYHGPGQLTVYPILDLRGYKQDIHWYMRALEEVILLALIKAGVKGATREDSLTGVWVANKKIAALGIKVRRWVTMHGVAINVDIRSLQNFNGIIPCGLEGRKVTCINEEKYDAPYLTVEEFSDHVKEALEEIFCFCLVPAK